MVSTEYGHSGLKYTPRRAPGSRYIVAFIKIAWGRQTIFHYLLLHELDLIIKEWLLKAPLFFAAGVQNGAVSSVDVLIRIFQLEDTRKLIQSSGVDLASYPAWVRG